MRPRYRPQMLDKDKANKKIYSDLIERRRLQELADLKSLLDTPFGKRFFIRILGLLGYMDKIYNKNNQIQSMNIGKYELAVDLMLEVGTVGIDLFTDMVKEHMRSTIEHRKTREQEVKESKS